MVEDAPGGATGACRIRTAKALRGRAGFVHCALGVGDSGVGGDVVVISSSSAVAAGGGGASDKTGGAVEVTSGWSSTATSGTQNYALRQIIPIRRREVQDIMAS